MNVLNDYFKETTIIFTIKFKEITVSNVKKNTVICEKSKSSDENSLKQRDLSKLIRIRESVADWAVHRYKIFERTFFPPKLNKLYGFQCVLITPFTCCSTYRTLDFIYTLPYIRGVPILSLLPHDHCLFYHFLLINLEDQNTLAIFIFITALANINQLIGA